MTTPFGPATDQLSPIGQHVLRRGGVEFNKYMTDQGFNIILFSGEEQLNYGCNVLKLGNGHVVSIERNVVRRISYSPFFTGTVQLVDFGGVTCVYGGEHCAIQVVHRDSLAWVQVD